MLGNRGFPEARSRLCVCRSLLPHDLCHGRISSHWLPAAKCFLESPESPHGPLAFHASAEPLLCVGGTHFLPCLRQLRLAVASLGGSQLAPDTASKLSPKLQVLRLSESLVFSSTLLTEQEPGYSLCTNEESTLSPGRSSPSHTLGERVSWNVE